MKEVCGTTLKVVTDALNLCDAADSGGLLTFAEGTVSVQYPSSDDVRQFESFRKQFLQGINFQMYC